MKHLVNTNLEGVGSFDFNSVYTEDVKKAQLDYAYGKDGSSADAEGQYVYDKFAASVAELPDEVTVLPRYDIEEYLKKGYNEIYVCQRCGDDRNDGTKGKPVATIEKAISLLKKDVPNAILVYAGEYCISDTLKITKEMSGTPDCPFIFSSVGDAEVVISAAKTLDISDFSPVEDDDEMAQRLPKHAKGKVLFADFKKKGWLDAQIGGITVYTTQEDIGVTKKFRSPTLFVGGKPMTLARYPNESENRYDLLYFDKVEDTGSVIDRDGSCLYLHWTARVQYYVERKAYAEGKAERPSWERKYLRMGREFPLYKSEEEANADYEKLRAREAEGYPPFIDKYGNYNMDMGFTVRMNPNDQANASMKSTQQDIDKISEWKSIYDRDVMIFGNAFSGWDYDRYKVKSIEKREHGCYITTKGGSRWGAMNSTNSPTGFNTYYLYNAIEALDKPGEWYMDDQTGRMYIYPTDEMKTEKIEYSANVCDLMSISADNVIVNGMHFDKGVSRGVVARDCEGVVVQGCRMTNMSNTAVLLDNTSRCAVIYNEIKYNRVHCISVYGQRFIEAGERQLNIAQNNVISDPIDNQNGINVCGYMNCASHNLLRMTNISVSGGGRPSLENIIEYNDIPGGNTSTSDAGLVYMNQFYSRGTHIRCNYMHSWQASGNGVYFDDLNSGNYAYYNIFDTTEAPGKKPRAFIYSSSGHDHMMFNNFCIGRTQIFEDGRDTDGKPFERTYTGTISSSIADKNEDGKYPFSTTVNGKSYTVMTEMTDRDTSFLYVGSTPLEDGTVLEVWSIKTHSDDEGDYVSLTWRYKDGSWRRCINYNDKINQSWMYFSDTSHLGYRFRGFADKFIDIYSGFAKSGAVYEKRFPELYTYMDMYKQYIADRDKTDYRINPLEIFIRSTAMNNVRNNIIVGVPRPFNRAEADSGVWGVDANGKDKLHISVNTDVYTGNFDISSDTYSDVLEYIEQYQDKSKPCPFDFRTLVKKVESEQKKQNPDYKSLEFVLDRAGIVK